MSLHSLDNVVAFIGRPLSLLLPFLLSTKKQGKCSQMMWSDNVVTSSPALHQVGYASPPSSSTDKSLSLNPHRSSCHRVAACDRICRQKPRSCIAIILLHLFGTSTRGDFLCACHNALAVETKRREKHINFFNMSFLALHPRTPSWAPRNNDVPHFLGKCKKGTHTNFFGGISGSQTGHFGPQAV